MTQSILLTQVNYTQLDPSTWCMTAQVSEPQRLSGFQLLIANDLWQSNNTISPTNTSNLNSRHWQQYQSATALSARNIAHHQRQIQRKGVRLLLQRLLDQLHIHDTLNETAFPYRLINSKYYVCFSHTGADSKNNTKHIAHTTDARLNNKVAVILSRHHPVGIDIEATNVAWHVVKRFYPDSEIAILQSLPTTERNLVAKLLWQIKESHIKIHQYTLAQGLAVDYSHLVADLISSIKTDRTSTTLPYRVADYQVVIFPNQQTVAVF